MISCEFIKSLVMEIIELSYQNEITDSLKQPPPHRPRKNIRSISTNPTPTHVGLP